ncbi:MAG: hypothetical protein EOP19_07350 [Hyphomicrobiales bacterium]|nr:MAG: hypothetical protein EOP19_07350 [Hyphomicrobiales bacterium]
MTKFVAPLALLVVSGLSLTPATATVIDPSQPGQVRHSPPIYKILVSEVSPGHIAPATKAHLLRSGAVFCIPSEAGSWSGFDVWNAVTCG